MAVSKHRKIPHSSFSSLIGLCAVLMAAATARPTPAGSETPPPPPQAPPIVLELSTGSVELQGGKESGVLQSAKPVELSVGSWLPEWRILCVASDAAGPNHAKVKASSLFMLPERHPEHPGQSYSGPPIPLNDPQVAAAGLETGKKMAFANALRFQAVLDPGLPAGEYRGTCQFILEGPDVPPEPGPVLHYTLCWEPFVDISMDPDFMSFGSLMPGEHDSNNPVKLTVDTNLAQLPVRVSMSELHKESGEGTVPRSALALGYGDNAGEARKNAAGTPYGVTEFVWECRSGKNRIFLVGRVNVTLDMTPGDYRGQIHVDYQPPAGN